ncbi:type II secretion system F family protein [Nesterenkonia populi]
MIPALAAGALAAVSILLLAPGGPRVGARLPGAAPRRRAPKNAEPGAGDVDAASLLDLTGALLAAGIGIEAALDRLARTVPGADPLGRMHRALAAGAGWQQASAHVEHHPQLALYCEHLSFSYATGAPSARMLEAAAAQARARQRHEAERAAGELGVKMMLPLGACFLPAFILLGVVPVIISMLPETLGL